MTKQTYLNITLIMILISFLGCAKKVETKIEYFKNGKIKSKTYYNKDSIQSPYSKMTFDENENLIDSLSYDRNGKINGIIFNQKQDYCKWTNYNNGIRQGKMEVHLNNGNRIIQHFINDSLNGVEYQYTADNVPIREILWIKDKPQIVKEIFFPSIGDTVINEIITNQKNKNSFEIINDSIEINIYNTIKDDSLIPFASIRYNNSGKVIGGASSNSYVSIEANDTIRNVEKLYLKLINYFGNIKDASWEIIIDNPFGINTQQQYYFVPIVADTANVIVENYKLGYNFFWGVIKLKRDSATFHQVWFYKDFYVKNE